MERQNAVRSLKRDEKGSVTILFAASAVTLLSLIGMGIDYGRARSMQADLQAGADAAALAAASAMTNSMASRSARADSVFQDNARAHSHVSDVRGQLTSVDNPDYGAVYRYTGSANVETLMLGLINIDELPVNVEAEAIARSSGTEIVIALDTTNSMTWGTKFSDATEMVEDALEAMKAAAGPRDFFVGFVPFTDRVNIGTHRSNWVNVNGMDMSQFEPGDDIPGPGKAKILDDWNGCVEPREERIGSYNWALDDDRPTGSKGWFKPSMKGFYNTPEWREPKCNDEIVGPYRDPDDVMDKIKNLKTDGTGRFDVGLAWAWRMMSRDWVGQWGQPNYPAKPEDRRKVALLVTDGHTTAYTWEVGGNNGDANDTFGYNKGTETGFEHLVDLCQRMKDEGIEIYIQYVPGNPSSIPYLKACASSANHYHEVNDRDSLKAALAALSPANAYVRLVK